MTSSTPEPPVTGGPQHIPRPASFDLGDAAPWDGLDAAARRPSIDDVRAVLDHGPPPRPWDGPHSVGRASAVLAPLYEEASELHVVLTRRAWHLRSHRGEISFPGGGVEPQDDDLWQTATREAMEEIDLDPGAVTNLGELDHLATVSSNSTIVPFVGAVEGRPDLTPSPDEVDGILHVPVARLLEPGVYHQERWRWDGLERPIHFFELDDDTLWGATAAMLVDLLTRLTGVDGGQVR